ncbi:ATP-binding cassette domain-containing protein [Methanothermobacter sp.]|uniref:ATP-binding cassette domain-containing protein n=1 Tax=Methanothermobacter sp. TaxID=1884223 RepID=UPI0026302245|nr:ATP-binding cassette domain-containing protein [Methanothermobacter sp.]MDI9618804.1 ATP-binding cassette domain-containing protein [Methanothermobacter sp.]
MKIIEAVNVRYTYPDGTEALKGINFHARRGEVVALLGPNGAGKSTLFLHFNGILQPTSGKVLVDGKEIDYSKSGLIEVRQKVGIVFQNPDDQLFAPRVDEDVAFGPLNMGLDEDEVKERVKDALRKVGMSGYEDRPPHHLSGGEKKRVAIAGILAMKPDIMILDEPTSGLDPRGASQILRLLHELNEEGMTIIISTHDVDLAPLYSDRIYIISGGEIISDGTPGDVFSDIDTIRGANLRLPRIAHLVEILQKEDDLPFGEPYPLTIGEARRKLREQLK